MTCNDFDSKYPELARFLVDFNGGDSFIESLASQLDRKGSLSDKQIAALKRSIERKAKWAEQRKQEEAEAPEQSPVIEGRIVILGKVLSVKGKSTPYGWVVKMLVQDFRGFKVYGSVPTNLIDRIKRGENVEVLANVEKSKDDETFGFFKRPANGVIVSN